MRRRLIHSTSGMELIRKLEPIFTSKQAREIAPSLGISLAYIRQVLHHLEKTGWIIRLRGGLYTLSSSIPGISPLHEFQVAMALVQPAAISHWSALSYHGMTEQIPKHVFVLTTASSFPRLRRAKTENPGPGYMVGEISYQFIKIKSEHFFGIEKVWINDSIVNITDVERTFLDCLMFPKYCGGFSEILYVFEQHSSKLNLKKIISYALKLDGATIKRLGWILENQGVALSRLTVLQKAPIKGYRLLDSTSPSRGNFNSRWMIQENLPGKIE